MITIQIDGKTYKPAKYEARIVEREVKRMITLCELEEVKENKEPETPQFTPGQMIEVSQDSHNWLKGKFEHYLSGSDYPYRIAGGIDCEYAAYKYARQPQEDIELLPELNTKWNTEYDRDWTIIESLQKIITVVNKLIKANKK